MRTRLFVASVLLMVGAVFACAGKKPPPKEPNITETIADAGPEDGEAADAEAPAAPKSLYERLGGKEAIAKVVDSFVGKVAADPVTKKRFAKIPKDHVEKFSKNLVDQICEASGGDCKYAGKSMKEAHKGMKITEAEWQATVAALSAALDENKVGETEKSDLIAAIAPMHDDIVEKQGTGKPAGKKKGGKKKAQ
jgi:hemoglobin